MCFRASCQPPKWTEIGGTNANFNMGEGLPTGPSPLTSLISNRFLPVFLCGINKALEREVVLVVLLAGDAGLRVG
jgi:hypothetical protein